MLKSLILAVMLIMTGVSVIGCAGLQAPAGGHYSGSGYRMGGEGGPGGAAP